MKTLITSVRLLAVLTLLTGALYPLVVWAVGQTVFPEQAEGSLVIREGHIAGSALLAQNTKDPRYFWPRPSATGFATVPSGASNQAWTSAKLATSVSERRAGSGGGALPADLLTASGSGLDPHLTPAAVRAQFDRVARARGFDSAQRTRLIALIGRLTEGGGLSPERVNVLRLNLELDGMTP